MRINALTILTILVICCFSAKTAIGQEIEVELSELTKLTMAAEEEMLLDVNGDTCSIAFIHTQLEGIKFYTNRGIEKIARTNNGYKIFLPSESSVLKIAVPEYP